MAFITPVVLKAQYGPDSGKLPADVLAVCGTKPWLMWEPAARCHRAMMAAARAAGFDPRSTGTYRSYARQEALFRERYSPTGQYGGCKMWHGVKWCKQLVNGRVPADAAVPGTSEHGWGCADDVAEELDGDIVAEAISPEFFAWLQANAWAYGFENTNRSERWHWAYCLGGRIPDAVLAYEQPPKPPDPPPSEEDPMRILILTDAGGAAVLLHGFTARWLDPARYNEYHLFYPIVDEQATVAWLKNTTFLGALPPGVTAADVWGHQSDAA